MGDLNLDDRALVAFDLEGALDELAGLGGGGGANSDFDTKDPGDAY